jgi:MYXO-CTERM domain-containing protein
VGYRFNNLCTSDRCVPATGCVQDPVEGPCDDGNDSTTVDACTDGVCVGSAPKTAGRGTPCSDRNPCTSGDLCDDEGLCVGEDVACVEGTCSRQTCCGSGAVDCEDDDPCTDDVCDDEEGCLHVDRCGPHGGVADAGPTDGGDAGSLDPVDAGTPAVDASVAADAGHGEEEDAGVDAGLASDAGGTSSDAGSVRDGAPRVDGAHADDSGVPAQQDAGPRGDADWLSGDDAGTAGGGGDEDGTKPGETCGCGTTPHSETPGFLAALGLAALVLARRRRAG